MSKKTFETVELRLPFETIDKLKRAAKIANITLDQAINLIMAMDMIKHDSNKPYRIEDECFLVNAQSELISRLGEATPKERQLIVNALNAYEGE
jgi:hypothetical protein